MHMPSLNYFMKIFLFFFLCSFLVYAKTPTVFKDFGDPLYANALKLEKLKELPIISKEKLDSYLKNVEEVKKFGNTLLKSDEKAKEKYFEDLRKLAKQNDIYVDQAREFFKQAFDKDDVEMFSKILESGLIDIKRNEEKIFEFYKKNKKDFFNKENFVDEIGTYKKLFKNIKNKEKQMLDTLRLEDIKDQNEIEKKLQNAMDTLTKEAN